jgi:hypothetical protein
VPSPREAASGETIMNTDLHFHPRRGVVYTSSPPSILAVYNNRLVNCLLAARLPYRQLFERASLYRTCDDCSSECKRITEYVCWTLAELCLRRLYRMDGEQIEGRFWPYRRQRPWMRQPRSANAVHRSGLRPIGSHGRRAPRTSALPSGNRFAAFRHPIRLGCAATLQYSTGRSRRR